MPVASLRTMVGFRGASLVRCPFTHTRARAPDPTVEDSYKKVVVVDGEAAVLDILDSAGPEEYAAMREQYVQGADVVVLVYSVASQASFHQDLERFTQSCAKVATDFPTVKRCVVLAGNKMDLAREVSSVEGQVRMCALRPLHLTTCPGNGAPHGRGCICGVLCQDDGESRCTL